ncbi:GerAB/ArcD/ProY family transporter, partial [Paenibacillus sp. TAF58]
IIMSGIYLFIISYLTLGSLGLNYIETSTYPFFATIQLVKFGENLERIEIILIGIWTIFTLIYIIVMQYVFTLVLGHVFKITKLKPFVFAIGLLFFAHACRSFIRTADHFTYGAKIYPISSMLPCVILPVLLAVVTMIKKRRKATIEDT